MKKKFFILIFVLLLITQIFTRFYQLFERADFGWDQVDNAWAAYNILVKHQLPLVGMEGKLNSGIFIGPLYYYLITPFYYFSNLDPIVSPLIAGLTSLLGFFTLFYVTKKIFNTETALIAIFINAVSISVINADRVQWPVNFIALISFWLFYFLYKVIDGSPKYILPLALATGFAFHIHFTAVFFPIIILITLPFFPRTKETLKYILLSIPAFLLLLLPMAIYSIQSKSTATASLNNYLTTYYHGLHLRRILQLAHDAFIKFEAVLFFKFFRPLVFIFYPLFSVLLIRQKRARKNWAIILLCGLWIIVPWIVFATYSGEISDYYFNSTLFVAMVILAYLIYQLLMIKFWPLRIMIVLFCFYYTFINIQQFLVPKRGSMEGTRTSAQNAVSEKRNLKFGRGNAEFYFYNYLKLKK